MSVKLEIHIEPAEKKEAIPSEQFKNADTTTPNPQPLASKIELIKLKA